MSYFTHFGTRDTIVLPQGSTLQVISSSETAQVRKLKHLLLSPYRNEIKKNMGIITMATLTSQIHENKNPKSSDNFLVV